MPIIPRLSAVVHTCNSRYSGGRDHEDCDLRPAWAKIQQYLISTNKVDVIPAMWEAMGSQSKVILGQKCKMLFEKYLKNKRAGTG
jgi:hypothetical protein